jgi:hypothetical protein
MGFVSEALPKSNRGRKTIELDPVKVEGLAELLKTQPTINERPASHRTDDEYSTKGRASSAGRRYADAIAEILKTTVRVNVFAYNEDASPVVWGWRVYVPMAEVKKEAAKK